MNADSHQLNVDNRHNYPKLENVDKHPKLENVDKLKNLDIYVNINIYQSLVITN